LCYGYSSLSFLCCRVLQKSMLDLYELANWLCCRKQRIYHFQAVKSQQIVILAFLIWLNFLRKMIFHVMCACGVKLYWTEYFSAQAARCSPFRSSLYFTFAQVALQLNINPACLAGCCPLGLLPESDESHRSLEVWTLSRDVIRYCHLCQCIWLQWCDIMVGALWFLPWYIRSFSQDYKGPMGSCFLCWGILTGIFIFQ
jgi:hypothetical protein